MRSWLCRAVIVAIMCGLGTTAHTRAPQPAVRPIVDLRSPDRSPFPSDRASSGIDWSTSTRDRSSCTGKTVAEGRKIATRVKNLRSGIPFVSLHYRTSNRLRPLALSSVHSQSLACSAPVGSAKSIDARLEARSSSAQKAHIDISRSVPVSVPKRDPMTIIRQPTPTMFPIKNGPEIVNFRPVL
jgi:hypothetical protein